MDGFQWVMLAVTLALVAAGIWLFISAFGRIRLRTQIGDTPTSKVRSVPMGKAELKGLATEFGRALSAPFSGAACVWNRWTVEEEKTTVDSKGRTRKSWDTVASGESTELFQLDDTTGQILVVPAGAEIDAPRLFSYTQGAVFGNKAAPLGSQYEIHKGGFFSGRRRFTEWRLDVKRPIYILGVVRPAREGERISVGQGRAAEPYFISSKSEKELLESMAWGVLGRFVFGAGLALGGLALGAHVFLGW